MLRVEKHHDSKQSSHQRHPVPAPQDSFRQRHRIKREPACFLLLPIRTRPAARAVTARCPVASRPTVGSVSSKIFIVVHHRAIGLRAVMQTQHGLQNWARFFLDGKIIRTGKMRRMR